MKTDNPASLASLLALTLNLFPTLMFAQFTQQGSKLVGTGAVGNAYQGSSVAISSDGNTALVGGPNDNNGAGAVWVYTRGAGIWTQPGAKLTGGDASGPASFGSSVALSADGNTAVVGGPLDGGIGAIWIFSRSGGVWSPQGSKLVGTGGSAQSTAQGSSVGISGEGNTVIEGDPSQGAVWVFNRSGGTWTQQGSKLIGTGSVGNAYQGCAVALSSDGNTAVVGGEGDNSGDGALWIFTRSAGVWTQQGPKQVGTGASSAASQAASVGISADGNTVVEGGVSANSFEGGVFIFARANGVWSQQGPLLVGLGDVPDTYGRVLQGASVAISPDGNWMAEGGYADSSGAGAVWAFNSTGAVWSQVGSKLVGTSAVAAHQGVSVALSSEGTLIEGGTRDAMGVGAAWVFNNPAVGPSTVSPQIQISLMSGTGLVGQDVQISWPTSASNFTLQFSHSLTAPIPWAVVTNAPVASNSQYNVRDPLTGTNTFYRLSYP